ncbi:MAG: signal peptidase I [Patescibacteria group bacterium]
MESATERQSPPAPEAHEPSAQKADPPRVEKARRFLTSLGEFVEVALVALAIIIPVRYFLVQPFYVRGASMEPSFYDHEYLIIDELSYRFRDPERGEIVVFRYPFDPGQFFIKRIIGLPGERVRLSQGNIHIANAAQPDGFTLPESYLGGAGTPGERSVELGEEEYFVMGDNRNASLDSRIFGPVKRTFIVGRVWLRGWPLSRIGHFATPAYNF